MISIIIPAYNEEKTIGILIDQIRETLQTKHEIIVIDDASTDHTPEISRNKKVILLQHTHRTKGDVLPALKIVKGDIIVRMDADLEHDPHDIPKMIKYLQEHHLDLVLGKRQEFSRKIEYVMKWLYQPPVEDFFTGYVVFSRKLLPLALKLGSTPLYWELPLLALKYNFKIGEVNVRYVRRKDKPRLGGEFWGGIRAWRLFLKCRRKIKKL